MKRPKKNRLIVGEKTGGWGVRMDPVKCTVCDVETALPVVRCLADKQQGPTIPEAQAHARAICYVPDFVTILRKLRADMEMLKTSDDTLAQELAHGLYEAADDILTNITKEA